MRSIGESMHKLYKERLVCVMDQTLWHDFDRRIRMCRHELVDIDNNIVWPATLGSIGQALSTHGERIVFEKIDG